MYAKTVGYNYKILQKYVALALNTHTRIIRSYTIAGISAEEKKRSFHLIPCDTMLMALNP